MNIIEVKNLWCRFPDGTPALKDITLSVREGEFILIAGPNGCGKTTLLRHLNGLLMPQTGSVTVAGIPVDKDPMRVRQMVGMVFQDADSQIVGETVYDDAAFGPENLGLDRAEIHKRVTESLDAVGMSGFGTRRPHLLSGGEKRRLAIAGILAMKSRVLIFDEPFSNLDYPGIRQMLKQMRSLHQENHTLIVTTHDLEKVLALADRLIVMQSGRIEREGPPAEAVKGIEAFGVREPFASRMGMGLSSWLS
jgi:biotin transport system ATP-binding protein